MLELAQFASVVQLTGGVGWLRSTIRVVRLAVIPRAVQTPSEEEPA